MLLFYFIFAVFTVFAVFAVLLKIEHSVKKKQNTIISFQFQAE